MLFDASSVHASHAMLLLPLLCWRLLLTNHRPCQCFGSSLLKDVSCVLQEPPMWMLSLLTSVTLWLPPSVSSTRPACCSAGSMLLSWWVMDHVLPYNHPVCWGSDDACNAAASTLTSLCSVCSCMGVVACMCTLTRITLALATFSVACVSALLLSRKSQHHLCLLCCCLVNHNIIRKDQYE